MNDTYGLKDVYPFGVYVWTEMYSVQSKQVYSMWRLAYTTQTEESAARLQHELKYNAGKVCAVARR